MIFNSQDAKYYAKIQKKHFWQKSQGVSKFLYLNDEPLKVAVYWLKTQAEIDQKLACWQGFNYDKCFLITNKNQFQTTNFLINVDIVNVDLNYQIKNIWTNVSPNTKLTFLDSYGHLFIFCANSIKGYGLELNQKLFTAKRW